MDKTKSKVLSGLIWKFGERISAQVVTFVVSVILARLLPTEAYGLITLVTIFITFANCVVTNGFGSALIQKKDADNTDFSSVLYFQLFASTVLYIILFLTAPLIAKFFGEGYDLLAPVLRVLGLRIPLTAINNVQQAYVSKKMIFRKFFFATIIGTVISAVVGIWMAYAGYGVWALVAQYLTNTTVGTIVLAFTIKWKPELKFSVKNLRSLFSYGWKILIASVIGAVMNVIPMFFYDKGKQLPNIIVTNINTTISSVLFPAISNAQNNINDVKNMMRRSIKTSAYIMCPLMFGLAVVAEPVISLLLTDKWLPCVPYLQIYCITYCFEPIQTANLQAIRALGRSDIILKLEIIKKGSSLLILFAVMNFGVNAIALSLFATTLIAAVANTLPNKKLINYSYKELMVDMSAGILISGIMAVIVYVLGMVLPTSTLVTLIIQVATGGIVYFAISAIFKAEAFIYLKNTVFELLGSVLKKKKAD